MELNFNGLGTKLSKEQMKNTFGGGDINSIDCTPECSKDQDCITGTCHGYICAGSQNSAYCG